MDRIKFLVRLNPGSRMISLQAEFPTYMLPIADRDKFSTPADERREVEVGVIQLKQELIRAILDAEWSADDQ